MTLAPEMPLLGQKAKEAARLLAKASPAEYIKTVWGIGFKMSDL